jgi:hypothetical protein
MASQSVDIRRVDFSDDDPGATLDTADPVAMRRERLEHSLFGRWSIPDQSARPAPARTRCAKRVVDADKRRLGEHRRGVRGRDEKKESSNARLQTLHGSTDQGQGPYRPRRALDRQIAPSGV